MDEGNLGFIELTCILKTSDQKRRGNTAWRELKKTGRGTRARAGYA